MSTKKAFNVSALVKGVLTRFNGKPKQEITEQTTTDAECRNPWQHNLERLATEHKVVLENIEKSDELTAFVTDLAKASQEEETKKAQAQKTGEKDVVHKPTRIGDRTITDMKSWWQDSLSPDDANKAAYQELPGKPRAMKRWFE